MQWILVSTFGFKAKTSTSYALFLYVAFLDCNKAYDRILHFGLFSKLIDRAIPLCILMVLIYWYLNMTCNFKWENQTSGSFKVPLGIKQGGINSPDFFGWYINDVTTILRKSNVGCYIFGIFLAFILFADDLCLLAPTRGALNKMIQLCAAYCKEYGLQFNASK